VTIGLFGGAFDPPHNGHVALIEAALERFDLERVLVLVVVDPGHRTVALDFGRRLELAHLAFSALPRTEIVLEEHAFTVDAVTGSRFGDAIFLVGADEFAAFLAWKDPNGVIEEVRLGVATRPGYDAESFESVLAQLDRPERVEFFEIPAVPVSARELRERIARGERIDGLVPEAVAREIEAKRLYRQGPLPRRIP
jgi:nicotinate-nucleotide adenylyltransferase